MAFRRLLRILALALTAAVTACTAFKEDSISSDAGGDAPAQLGAGVEASANDFPTADDRGDGVPDPRCDTAKPFGRGQPALGLTNAGLTSNEGLRLLPDYETGYFSGSRLGSDTSGDLYAVQRNAQTLRLDEATPVDGTGINTADNEGDPTFDRNTLTLIFARSQGNSTHLYHATRSGRAGPFVYAGLLPGANEPAASDQTPFLREDGQVLYFASSRVPARGTDIYRAARTGTALGTPEAVAELNTESDELCAAVTPDDLTIYFASNRPGGAGYEDIWMATRPSIADPFSAPRNVTELNTTSSDRPSFVTRDGCTLYYTTGEGAGGAPFLVYVATRPPA
jgi:Tol biopolymer transport system component